MEDKLDKLVETPLPIPHPEVDFQTVFGEVACSDGVCKTMFEA
jgi:hypothetical protein